VEDVTRKERSASTSLSPGRFQKGRPVTRVA
jgi:hypothetical protein